VTVLLALIRMVRRIASLPARMRYCHDGSLDELVKVDVRQVTAPHLGKGQNRYVASVSALLLLTIQYMCRTDHEQIITVRKFVA
jgi:hypothetical protein